MPSPAGRLTLVGTLHRSGGLHLLVDVLNELQPDYLTLEMSPYALVFRQTRGPHLLSRLETILDLLAAEASRRRERLAAHPEVAGIRSLLALPFEYEAAAAHTARTGIPLELLGSSLVSARKLQRVEKELVTPENLRTLLEIPPVPHRRETVEIARSLLFGQRDAAIRQAFLACRRSAEGIGERDRRLASALRQRLVPGRHLVHIGGWVHLVEDPQEETLYSRVRDLEPGVLLLEG